MTPVQIALLVRIGIVAALLLGGFAGGWAVQGWRLGAKLAELEGVRATQVQTIETLRGVNKSCAAGVDEVKKAVKGYVDAAAERDAAAARALAAVAGKAQAYIADSKVALGRPAPAPGQECDTVAGELGAYARKRRAAP